jgi:hypothetical protein
MVYEDAEELGRAEAISLHDWQEPINSSTTSLVQILKYEGCLGVSDPSALAVEVQVYTRTVAHHGLNVMVVLGSPRNPSSRRRDSPTGRSQHESSHNSSFQ